MKRTVAPGGAHLDHQGLEVGLDWATGLAVVVGVGAGLRVAAGWRVEVGSGVLVGGSVSVGVGLMGVRVGRGV